MLSKPHDPEEFDSSLAPAIPRSALEAVLARGGRIARLVISFLFGQGAVQGLNVLIGLFLVRRLSVEAYAQFGVASGFQNLFSVLMDLGFASTIIPMVGERVGDRALIGRYVRAAQGLRDTTFLLLAPIAAITFLAVIHQRHWSGMLQAGLLASILLTLYSGGIVGFFSAPLFLERRFREFYVPQVLSAAGRLALCVLLWSGGVLTAWAAAGLGAISVASNALFIRKAALECIVWPERDSKEIRGELIRYVLPATPAIIFSAFQGQISLFLISLFGSTLNIAEVSALARIGQIFSVLMTFNTMMVEPYIARTPEDRLVRVYLQSIAIATVALVPLVWLSFREPAPFIWIIGRKFSGLEPFMGWFVLSAAMNFVSGLAWIMNRARKWVFWSGSMLEIVLLLGIQATFLAMIGVRTTQQAVFLGLASSFGYAITHGYVAVLGFTQRKRTATA
jgi:O-antigen/teichoic acid export membrane protein